MSVSELGEEIKQRGDVEIIIDHLDGRREVHWKRNCILQTAKQSQASALANSMAGNSFQYYIDKMIFGTQGTLNGAPKVVKASRNGLFGPTVLSKPVVATINPQMLSQAVFTTVINFDEGNGNVLNEMALVMKTGDLYSMVTLGGISKNNTIQITFNWRLTFV